MFCVEEMPQDVGSLQTLVKNLTFEVRSLQEKLRLMLANKYGKSSEKLSENQLSLFGDLLSELVGPRPVENAEEEQITVPEHTRHKGGRKPLPEHLERVRVEHDLSEAEKECECGCGKRVRIGEEISEQLDIIPAQVRVIQHVRFKYGCPKGECGVKIAPLPPQPIPKSNASASLLAHIAVSKYQDALPLYRQESILERSGIQLSRTTSSDWMIQCGKLVDPLLNLCRDHLLDQSLIQMDETTLQVLKEPGRSADSKSYMWVQGAGPPGKTVILFEYDSSRSGDVARRLLMDYQGKVQTDGYRVYEMLQKLEGITWVGCLAHARRKFMEALKALGSRVKAGKAHEGLAWIRDLYRIEKEARDFSPEARKEKRQKEAKPIWAAMRLWLDKALLEVPPKTKTGEALHYLNNRWGKFQVYLEDGDIPIDNNAAERAIRPFVIGRKNWIFCDTPEGARANANLYSLIETAKANGLKVNARLTPSFRFAEDFG
jgi:transposase